MADLLGFVPDRVRRTYLDLWPDAETASAERAAQWATNDLLRPPSSG